MKPVKSLVSLAKWILRIASVAIVYSDGHFHNFIELSFKGLSFFLSAAYVIVTILLIIGGFISKASTTVVSGLLLLVLCMVSLFVQTGFSVPNLIEIIPLAAIGFYFMARGNQV
ncbi:MAG: hypothetical protein JXA77_18600 [Bacteroidales bacterium]|nr:hypothetical protein [Bacteroidales bacterium]MBN2818197.1 hypothetical protein [Bacteroidales bacterium]